MSIDRDNPLFRRTFPMHGKSFVFQATEYSDANLINALVNNTNPVRHCKMH
ncbi:unnamed protein product [Tenebrio molitor]|nr:unnamed protein product [Tenebrio molitor]